MRVVAVLAPTADQHRDPERLRAVADARGQAGVLLRLPVVELHVNCREARVGELLQRRIDAAEGAELVLTVVNIRPARVVVLERRL